MLNCVEVNRNILPTISKVVETTLGPKGRYIVLSNLNESAPTKDGVSCIRFFRSPDNFSEAIIRVIQEAAKKTLEQAGDGTTSTIVLANKMYSVLESGASEVELRNKVNDMLSGLSKEVIKVDSDDIVKRIALTSVAGDEELAECITEAFRLSRDGNNIIVDTAIGEGIEVNKVDGVSFNAVIAKDGFGHSIEMDDVIVVPYAGTMESEVELVSFLNNLSKVVDRANIVFIATGYTEEVMSTILVNHLSGEFKMVPLMVSGGVIDNVEVVKVLGATVNAKIYGPDVSILLDDIDVNELVCQNENLKFMYKNKKAMFTNIDNKAISDELLSKYKEKLDNAATDEESAMYRYILSLLSRESVVIKIKARLNSKIMEIKDRLDDAIGSITTAKAHGAVYGGGETYKILNEKYGKNTDYFDKIFNYLYYKLVGHNEVSNDKKPLDSAYTIEVVLRNALELASVLHNTSYVIAQDYKK